MLEFQSEFKRSKENYVLDIIFVLLSLEVVSFSYFGDRVLLHSLG